LLDKELVKITTFHAKQSQLLLAELEELETQVHQQETNPVDDYHSHDDASSDGEADEGDEVPSLRDASPNVARPRRSNTVERQVTFGAQHAPYTPVQAWLILCHSRYF